MMHVIISYWQRSILEALHFVFSLFQRPIDQKMSEFQNVKFCLVDKAEKAKICLKQNIWVCNVLNNKRYFKVITGELKVFLHHSLIFLFYDYATIHQAQIKYINYKDREEYTNNDIYKNESSHSSKIVMIYYSSVANLNVI